MKTPMQQLFHRIEQLRFAKNPIDELMMIRLEMLEKEEDYHKRMREIVAQELHNLGMPTDRAIDQAAFESSYGYSDDNYNSFKEGVKWVIEQLKTFNTKER